MPTNIQPSSMILDQDLISKDETLSKFWSGSCQANQSGLWLPHQIVSQDRGSHLSSKLLNFTEEKSSFWKTTISPKVLTRQHLSVFSLHSAIPKAGKEVRVVTRKIRIYPNEKNKIFDLLSLHRRAYNLAIDHFINIPIAHQHKITDLRREIKKIVKVEWEDRFYYAEVAGEAVRAAFKTRQAVIRKRIQKKKCGFSFKSIKESEQYFVAQRLTKKFMGMFHVTEDLPSDAYGRTTNICFEHGRWFVCALGEIEIKIGAENQGLSVASIDPGVRTFATVYSRDKAYKFGDEFYKGKVFPLLLKVDKLIGERQIFFNKKFDFDSQFYKDTIRFYTKKNK